MQAYEYDIVFMGDTQLQDIEAHRYYVNFPIFSKVETLVQSHKETQSSFIHSHLTIPL